MRQQPIQNMKTKIACLALLLPAFYLLLPSVAQAGQFATMAGGALGGRGDKNDNLVINPQFDAARSLIDGLDQMKLSRKPGYINLDGRFVGNPTH